MTQLAASYAVCLYELAVPREELKETEKLIKDIPQILQVLTSPVTPVEQKFKVIDQIFPEHVRNFLKVLCKNREAEILTEILDAYEQYFCEQEQILPVRLTYVDLPEENILPVLEKKLCTLYGKEKAELELCEDKNLIGGFVIRTGDYEYDWSLAGRLNQLMQKLIRR